MTVPNTEPLREEPCKGDCHWRSSGRLRDGKNLYHCTACEGEWDRDESWIPIESDGSISKWIQRELDES